MAGEGLKIGIIGAGKMGFSLAKGLLAAGTKRGDIKMSDKSGKRLDIVRRELGVEKASSNRDLVASSNMVFLVVKPSDVREVLSEIKDVLDKRLLISFAAGIQVKTIERELGKKAKVIRVMPNIACSVLEGVLTYSLGGGVTAQDEKIIVRLLDGLGLVVKVKESEFDAITGLSGSGPAYISLVIEALAQAGVKEGLSRELAMKLAAQTVKGAGELVKSGMTPSELIDMVRSPGGTTEEGLRVLEKRGVVEALKEAVKAAAKRSRELSRAHPSRTKGVDQADS